MKKKVVLAIPIYIKDKEVRSKKTRKVVIIKEKKISLRKKVITFKELENGEFVKEYNRLEWKKGDIRMVEADKWKFISSK